MLFVSCLCPICGYESLQAYMICIAEMLHTVWQAIYRHIEMHVASDSRHRFCLQHLGGTKNQEPYCIELMRLLLSWALRLYAVTGPAGTAAEGGYGRAAGGQNRKQSLAHSTGQVAEAGIMHQSTSLPCTPTANPWYINQTELYMTDKWRAFAGVCAVWWSNSLPAGVDSG